MIVKVQASVATNHPEGQQILIYNKSRNVSWDQTVTPEFKKLLRGRPKAFFHAKLVDTKIMIGQEAEWQSW